MRLSRISFPLFTVLFVLLCAGSAYAQEHANIARGFNSETPFQLGDVDSVNTFSGNLVLTVPIGQEYHVGGNLSYALRLVYNGQALKYSTIASVNYCFFQACTESGSWTEAIPDPLSNAGVGWQLTLGELTGPDWTPYGTITDAALWAFYSSDGSKHSFYKVPYPHLVNTEFAAGAPGSKVFGYTRDSTYMRLRGEVVNVFPYGNAGRMTVEQSNGTVYTFQSPFTSQNITEPPKGARYYLQSITDAYGNSVRIEYLYRDTNGVLNTDPGRNPEDADVQRITEIPAGGAAGRQHEIEFTDVQWYQTKMAAQGMPAGFWTQPDLVDYGFIHPKKIIDKIRVSARGGTALYTLTGEFATIQEPCDAFLGWKDRRMRIRRLTSIDGPEGFRYAFGYPELGDITRCAAAAHHIDRVDLPTGASIHYEMTRRAFPIPLDGPPDHRSICVAWLPTGECTVTVSSKVVAGKDHRPPFADPFSVASRTVVDPLGATTTHTYSTTRRCPSTVLGGERFQEIVVMTDSPGGERTLNYFTVDIADVGQDDYPASVAEYALPYSKLPQSEWEPGSGYFLSTEVMSAACAPFAYPNLVNSCESVNACDSKVMRRTYVKYELDGYIGIYPHHGASDDGSQTDLNRRLAGTITVTRKQDQNGNWVDDICSDNKPCYTKVEYSDFDGLGHYRKETR